MYENIQRTTFKGKGSRPIEDQRPLTLPNFNVNKDFLKQFFSTKN